MIPYDSSEPASGREPESTDFALVGQLTASTSHRINNLLHRIGGGEILVESGIQTVDLDKVSRGWLMVKKAQARITMMMANLLFFSQPFQPYRSPSSLDQIMEQVEDNISDAFNSQNFKIRNRFSDGCLVELDSYHTGMAIENIVSVGLIGNAGREPSEQSRVELEAGENEKGLSLRFNLLGLDATIDLGKLLNRELKAENAEHGMLEVLVARKIIEAQGGSINVVAPNEVAPNEVGQHEVGPNEVAPDNVGSNEVAPDNVAPDNVAPNEVAPDNVAPNEVAPDNVAPDNVAPDNVAPDNVALDNVEQSIVAVLVVLPSS